MKATILCVFFLLPSFAFAQSYYTPKIEPDKDVIALTLLLEARCQGEDGMLAVLNVIINRSNKSNQSLKDECVKPKQFSCWNAKLPQWKAANLLSSKEGLLASRMAAWVLAGKSIPNLTYDATHYHNDSMTPKWARNMTKTVVIGRHIFYKES